MRTGIADWRLHFPNILDYTAARILPRRSSVLNLFKFWLDITFLYKY